MTKKIFLETLKSVLGRSIYHYCGSQGKSSLKKCICFLAVRLKVSLKYKQSNHPKLARFKTGYFL